MLIIMKQIYQRSVKSLLARNFERTQLKPNLSKTPCPQPVIDIDLKAIQKFQIKFHST